MFNQFPYNRYRNYYNRYNNYNPAFTNNYNAYNANIQNQNNINDVSKEAVEDKTNNEDISNTNANNNIENEGIKFGPFSLNSDRLSIFGFNIQIDDLLIIGLILILLLETEKNYPLIIVLGLMLFNINFSNLHLF